MEISSPAFKNNGEIPIKYAVPGQNINPPLIFSNVPENVKSLVLIMDDPDAPIGTWVHWVLWNINPKTKEIPENFVPQGAVQGKTSRENHYSGPNPPSGAHRYFFKLYALDTRLNISGQTDANTLLKLIERNIIAQAELIGTFTNENN